MRNGLLTLALLGVAILALLLLLPVLGFLFLVVIGLLLLAVGAFLAAPLLARLPWFRDWISVEEYGGRRVIRFGHSAFGYRGRGSAHRGPDPDVIDVEGREIPDHKD